MSQASRILRDARLAARLTQAELAERLGTTQPAVARLERDDANPTIETLDRALRATGHRLQLIAPAWSGESSIDESLIRQALALTPAERIRQLGPMAEQARVLAAAGARARAAHA